MKSVMLMADPFEYNNFVIQIPQKYKYLTMEPIKGYLAGMPLLKNVKFGIHDATIFRQKPVWADDIPVEYITFQFTKQDYGLYLRFEKFLYLLSSRYDKVQDTEINLGQLFMQTWRDTSVFAEI